MDKCSENIRVVGNVRRLEKMVWSRHEEEAASSLYEYNKFLLQTTIIIYDYIRIITTCVVYCWKSTNAEPW